MDKDDVVHIYNGILLLSHKKKEQNNAIFSNMDGPRDCHIERSKAKITYMWNFFKLHKLFFTKEKQSHRCKKQTCFQGGNRGGIN